MKLNAITVFAMVTGCALTDMVLGGLFGFGAGHLAPELFSTVIPWKQIEPVGTATVLAAAVGVILGGALGTFAVLLQFVSQLLAARRARLAGPATRPSA